MQDKSSRLLADLERIEKILGRMPLWHPSVREDLARIVIQKQFFSHELGKLFVLTLRKGNSYQTQEKQQMVREESARLLMIVRTYLCGNMDECLEWAKKLEKQAVPFDTWINRAADRYLPILYEERMRQELEDTLQRQKYDLKLMGSLIENTNLEVQEEVDALYDELINGDGCGFQTWIGREFVGQLQKRTTKYHRRQRKRKFFGTMSTVSLVIALVLVGIWAKEQVELGKEQWKNQVWDELRADLASSSQQENLKNEVQTDSGQGIVEIREEPKKKELQSKEIMTVLSQYKQFQKNNPDFIGWLTMDGIDLSLPVLQRVQDEEYYLTHNFEGESTISGSLFIDAKIKVEELGRNTVIYGHNMKNGDIFGKLDYYESEEFWSKNPSFQFDTLYKEGTYEIIAVLKTHIRKEGEFGFRYYNFYDYNSEGEFQALVDFIQEDRLYDTGIEPVYGDSFLMLSTCDYSEEEGRLVVVGRLVT